MQEPKVSSERRQPCAPALCGLLASGSLMDLLRASCLAGAAASVRSDPHLIWTRALVFLLHGCAFLGEAVIFKLLLQSCSCCMQQACAYGGAEVTFPEPFPSSALGQLVLFLGVW